MERAASASLVSLASAAWLVAASTGVTAQHWPQWRGPSSLGVSPETGLPTTWSPTERVAWKAPLAGLGTSSPIVWGDLVIVTSQIGSAALAGGDRHPQLARDDRALAEREHPIGGQRAAAADGKVWLVVEAFRRSDGKRQWEHRMEATGPLPELHEKHNLATPTPASDGERVYAWFRQRAGCRPRPGRLASWWIPHLAVEYSLFQVNWGQRHLPGASIAIC